MTEQPDPLEQLRPRPLEDLGIVTEGRRTAYDPPADPIAALRDALDRIRASTREILVHPDTPAVVVERITSASPLVRVRRSSLVPRPDVVLVSRPDAQGPMVLPRDLTPGDAT